MQRRLQNAHLTVVCGYICGHERTSYFYVGLVTTIIRIRSTWTFQDIYSYDMTPIWKNLSQSLLLSPAVFRAEGNIDRFDKVLSWDQVSRIHTEYDVGKSIIGSDVSFLWCARKSRAWLLLGFNAEIDHGWLMENTKQLSWTGTWQTQRGKNPLQLPWTNKTDYTLSRVQNWRRRRLSWMYLHRWRFESMDYEGKQFLQLLVQGQ